MGWQFEHRPGALWQHHLLKNQRKLEPVSSERNLEPSEAGTFGQWGEEPESQTSPSSMLPGGLGLKGSCLNWTQWWRSIIFLHDIYTFLKCINFPPGYMLEPRESLKKPKTRNKKQKTEHLGPPSPIEIRPEHQYIFLIFLGNFNAWITWEQSIYLGWGNRLHWRVRRGLPDVSHSRESMIPDAGWWLRTELAPGGVVERRGRGDGHLKSVFCPERQFPASWALPAWILCTDNPRSLSQHGEGYSARFSASPYFITNPSPLVPVLNRCN